MNEEYLKCMKEIWDCMSAYADYAKSDCVNEELYDKYRKMYNGIAEKLVKKFN